AKSDAVARTAAAASDAPAVPPSNEAPGREAADQAAGDATVRTPEPARDAATIAAGTSTAAAENRAAPSPPPQPMRASADADVPAVQADRSPTPQRES